MTIARSAADVCRARDLESSALTDVSESVCPKLQYASGWWLLARPPGRYVCVFGADGSDDQQFVSEIERFAERGRRPRHVEKGSARTTSRTTTGRIGAEKECCSSARRREDDDVPD